MAKNSTVAWAAFPSRGEAGKAVQRLSSAGFARNSIDVDRADDASWYVAVRTSERNRRRVEDLLRASTPLHALRRHARGAYRALWSNPLVLAAAALVGIAAAYSLLPRHRRLEASREFPRRMHEAVQDLPETLRDAAQTVRDTAGELFDRVRDAASPGEDREAQPSDASSATRKD